jgi:dsDNA-specific endonuclease/ATPase MutS2
MKPGPEDMLQGGDEHIEGIERMTDAEEAEMLGQIPDLKEMRDERKAELDKLVDGKNTNEARIAILREEIEELNAEIEARKELEPEE